MQGDLENSKVIFRMWNFYWISVFEYEKFFENLDFEQYFESTSFDLFHFIPKKTSLLFCAVFQKQELLQE